MPFVLDASVAAVWAFEDESHSTGALALEMMRTDTAWVPSLWWFELRNILIVGERRGRISQADTAIFLQALSRLAINVDRMPEEAVVLGLARKHRLSVYDASYLELALRQRWALASLDAALLQAATAEGVGLLRAAGEMDQPATITPPPTKGRVS